MKFLLGIFFHNDENRVSALLESLESTFALAESIHIFLIDDHSMDGTLARLKKNLQTKSNLHLIQNARAYGYGGTQKILCRMGIANGFDALAIMPATSTDSQLKSLAGLFRQFEADPKDLLVGISDRVPIRSFFSAVASKIQSQLAGEKVRGWRSPYKIYATSAVEKTAYELNTNGAYFDTELMLQLIDQRSGAREISHADYRDQRNGALNTFTDSIRALKASLKYKLQQYNLFYDIRYFPENIRAAQTDTEAEQPSVYQEKFDSMSPHALVAFDDRLIPLQSVVLDIGCSTGYVASQLIGKKKCRVTGIDMLPEHRVHHQGMQYRQINLENNQSAVNAVLREDNFDVVLLLDVLEHLSAPELFLLNLNRQISEKPPKFLMSTGNVAFIAIRLMLAMGFFNYGKRGILDITHKRLFSLRTFRNLMEQTGFLIDKEYFFPLPFHALGFPKKLAMFLEKVNVLLIRIRPSLFAYQVMMEATPITVPTQK